MQEVISIRVPKRLKEKMRKYDFNWKEYLIEAIEDKLRQLESEDVLREIDKMNEKLAPSTTPSWKMIREDRDNDSR